MTRHDELDALQDVVGRLRLAYGSVDEATVEAAVLDAYEIFKEARIRAFVPILVERRARSALDAGPPTVPATPETPGTPAPLPAPGTPTGPREGSVAALP
ncbi:three-helix bundle dimerization domain-containing protein [Streptomyces phaeofaciens]